LGEIVLVFKDSVSATVTICPTEQHKWSAFDKLHIHLSNHFISLKADVATVGTMTGFHSDQKDK
jgi:hypothetical protein